MNKIGNILFPLLVIYLSIIVIYVGAESYTSNKEGDCISVLMEGSIDEYEYCIEKVENTWAYKLILFLDNMEDKFWGYKE